eukprot:6190239-Pleurochrysis_carterae.AAC.2
MHDMNGGPDRRAWWQSMYALGFDLPAARVAAVMSDPCHGTWMRRSRMKKRMRCCAGAAARPRPGGCVLACAASASATVGR